MMRLVLLLCVLTLSACGGMDPQPCAAPHNFAVIQTRVINLSCSLSSSCHRGGASAAGQLSLEMPGAYEALMRPAMADPSKMLIVPGDPDHSYVMDKLLNRNVGNLFMPPTGQIEADRIELVRCWIADGAMND
jgi:hypothetical protein